MNRGKGLSSRQKQEPRIGDRSQTGLPSNPPYDRPAGYVVVAAFIPIFGFIVGALIRAGAFNRYVPVEEELRHFGIYFIPGFARSLIGPEDNFVVYQLMIVGILLSAITFILLILSINRSRPIGEKKIKQQGLTVSLNLFIISVLMLAVTFFDIYQTTHGYNDQLNSDGPWPTVGYRSGQALLFMIPGAWSVSSLAIAVSILRVRLYLKRS
jgi:fumarate reductase subunit D